MELPDGRPIPALLLANKSDLQKREVRTEQVFSPPLLRASPCKVAALHKLHGFLGWAEVSAKDDHMLRETVTFLVDAMVSHCLLVTHRPTMSNIVRYFQVSYAESEEEITQSANLRKVSLQGQALGLGQPITSSMVL